VVQRGGIRPKMANRSSQCCIRMKPTVRTARPISLPESAKEGRQRRVLDRNEVPVEEHANVPVCARFSEIHAPYAR
jgi:hypothetical protein